MSIEKPFLRDGVDVYVRRDDEIQFVFLSTRRRLIVKASVPLIHALAWLDGQHTTSELQERFAATYGASRRQDFAAFLDYLQHHGIVVERDWLSQMGLTPDVLETQQRQLNFLLDVLETPQKVAAAQGRISRARIVIFGAGAVGSWTVRLLLGLGFRCFTLVDHDTMNPSDVARHAFADTDALVSGRQKTEWLARLIEDEFSGATVRAVTSPLSMETDLSSVIDTHTSLVINAADEPYIGYTSVLLSRFCIPRRLPLLVAGGFDAHLASVGEMIIPGVTPCADCYAEHFRVALADWRPFPHPVTDRRDGFGGLCSLSVFSAAAAAMSVLRLFAFDDHVAIGGRGELLFDDYRLDRFKVERQPGCPYCGNL